MGLFLSNGSRLTKAGVPTQVLGDPLVKLTSDVYKREHYGSGDNGDTTPEGGLRSLFGRAGTIVRQSVIDAEFPAPDITGVAPANGAAVGGTVVTLTGINLDGVTAVTFGGTPGTSLTIVSATKVTVVAPAHAAGAVDIGVTDDGGTDTVVAGFTYA